MTREFLIGTWRGLVYTGTVESIYRQPYPEYRRDSYVDPRLRGVSSVCDQRFLNDDSNDRYVDMVHEFRADGTWLAYNLNQTWRDRGRWRIEGGQLLRQIDLVEDPAPPTGWRPGATIAIGLEARSMAGIDYWTPTPGHRGNPRWWFRCPDQ